MKALFVQQHKYYKLIHKLGEIILFVKKLHEKYITLSNDYLKYI